MTAVESLVFMRETVTNVHSWLVVLLRVYSVMLCMACSATTGMGNRLRDRITTAGVEGDDWVTCMGHGRHDTLGNEIHGCTHGSVMGVEYRNTQECSG